MKLTKEQDSDLQTLAALTTDAPADQLWQNERALSEFVQRLMTAAYEAGIKQGMENARAIASYGQT